MESKLVSLLEILTRNIISRVSHFSNKREVYYWCLHETGCQPTESTSEPQKVLEKSVSQISERLSL